MVLQQELTAIDGGPNCRREPKNEVILARVDNLASIFGMNNFELAVLAILKQIIIRFDDIGVVPVSKLIKLFEGVDFEIIIGLEDTDIFAMGKFNSLVHTVAIAGVRLVENDYARVFGGEFLDDSQRIISGAVVDTDDFEFGEGLVDQASESRAQKLGSVVNWNKN